MAHNIRINFAGQAGPPGGAAICIEPRSLGLVDGSLSYVNGEFGGRVTETGAGGAREHVDVSTGNTAHVTRARALLLAVAAC